MPGFGVLPRGEYALQHLKSVTPLLFMEPNRDVELAGITIPKGTFLMLVNRCGALREENFTDAHEFKPERWLESNPPACAHNRNASAPFGAGPRFCPGRNLALLEIKMAMLCYARIFRLPGLKRNFPFKRFFHLP